MLVVKKPTSSTIQYTVTSRCPVTTLAGYALKVLELITRLLGATLALAIIVSQHQRLLLDSPVWDDTLLQQSLSKIQLFSSHELHYVTILAATTALLWLAFRRGYTEESLLVIRGLGVQTSTSSSSYLLASSTRFIPATAIQDIFIHEAFIGFKVKFYLSIVVEGEDKVVVVFPTIMPRLPVLEPVWRGARACLFD